MIGFIIGSVALIIIAAFIISLFQLSDNETPFFLPLDVRISITEYFVKLHSAKHTASLILSNLSRHFWEQQREPSERICWKRHLVYLKILSGVDPEEIAKEKL